MFDFANLSHLCNETAKTLQIPKNLVVKDFWVTTILDWFFNKTNLKKYFVFKGGTSLSKVYHLIKRFSEDIDLGFDYHKLGISDQEINLINNGNQAKKIH